MSFIVAGIGSRQTPASKLKEIRKLSRWLVEAGGWIRSGHADGADYAFEEGARDRSILYLPWSGYNSEKPYLSTHILSLDQARSRTLCMQSVYRYHPRPMTLKASVKKLHARNHLIICGEGRAVDAVVYWAQEDPGGHVRGGTGQGIRIARSLNIPCFNLSQFSAAEIQRELCKLLPTLSVPIEHRDDRQ